MRTINEIKTLDQLKSKLKYNYKNLDWKQLKKVILNCHIGHRKLCCVLIEFFNECKKNNIDVNNSFVLYVGSAPGISINIASILYPNLEWLLYDKNVFLIKSKPTITKVSEYFDDNSIEYSRKMFEKSGKKYFLFISDLRTSPDDDFVFDDMINQQKWLIKLNVDFYSLKIRFPYYIDNKIYPYDLSDLGDSVHIAKSDFEINKFVYLNGKIFIQAYPPKRSTETRLIGSKPYKLVQWNIVDYEDKLCYFNVNLRNNAYFYKDSEKIMLFNTYDHVREYQIYSDHIDLNSNNSISPKFDIVGLYNLIDKIFNKYNILNGISCKMKMYCKKMNFVLSNKDFNPREKKIIIQSMNENVKKDIKLINEKIDKLKGTHCIYKYVKISIDDNFLKYNKSTKNYYINKKLIEKYISNN